MGRNVVFSVALFSWPGDGRVLLNEGIAEHGKCVFLIKTFLGNFTNAVAFFCQPGIYEIRKSWTPLPDKQGNKANMPRDLCRQYCIPCLDTPITQTHACRAAAHAPAYGQAKMFGRSFHSAVIKARIIHDGPLAPSLSLFATPLILREAGYPGPLHRWLAQIYGSSKGLSRGNTTKNSNADNATFAHFGANFGLFWAETGGKQRFLPKCQFG